MRLCVPLLRLHRRQAVLYAVAAARPIHLFIRKQNDRRKNREKRIALFFVDRATMSQSLENLPREGKRRVPSHQREAEYDVDSGNQQGSRGPCLCTRILIGKVNYMVNTQRHAPRRARVFTCTLTLALARLALWAFKVDVETGDATISLINSTFCMQTSKRHDSNRVNM